MPLIDKCEVRKGKTWETIGIAQALERRGEDMRCGECKGRFVPHRKYNTGARAHFEHQTVHKGCSTKEATFVAPRSTHPTALV
jgi:hypothetical protein